MTPEEFVACIRKPLLEDSLADYRQIFERATKDTATDPYWRRVLELYASLNHEQQAVILEMMRQVSVDTISGFLAILDGTTVLEHYREDFCLSYDGGEKLNGYLQDCFLADET